MEILLYIILLVIALLSIRASCNKKLYYFVTRKRFVASILLFIASIVIAFRIYKKNRLVEGLGSQGLSMTATKSRAGDSELFDAIIKLTKFQYLSDNWVDLTTRSDEIKYVETSAQDWPWTADSTGTEPVAEDTNYHVTIKESAEAELETYIITNYTEGDALLYTYNDADIKSAALTKFGELVDEKLAADSTTTVKDAIIAAAGDDTLHDIIEQGFEALDSATDSDVNICDDERAELTNIYNSEIDLNTVSYYTEINDLRDKIVDGQELDTSTTSNKIDQLTADNTRLTRTILDYLKKRERNCKFDKSSTEPNSGDYTSDDRNAYMGALVDSANAESEGVSGFTNMFSGITYKETLQMLKKDREFLDNMSSSINKTRDELEIDILKNEYRTAAYALGTIVLVTILVSKFQK
mgnify:CR=1 FL=1